MGRLIDTNDIRVKPQYMQDVMGIAMIRCEDLSRILADVPTVEAISKEKMIEMYDKIVKTSYGTAEHYPKYKGIMLYEAQMIIDIMKEYLFKENEDATN